MSDRASEFALKSLDLVLRVSDEQLKGDVLYRRCIEVAPKKSQN